MIVGFGEACRLAKKEMASDLKHIAYLNQLMRDEFSKRLTHITFNGDLVSPYFREPESKKLHRIIGTQEISMCHSQASRAKD